MTLENLQRRHKQLTFLASGNFKERDFDIEMESADDELAGMKMGKMSAERRELIQGDAKRHLASLEKKHPECIPKETKEKEIKSKKEA